MKDRTLIFTIADRSLRLRGVDRDCKYFFNLTTEKRGAVPSDFLLELWVVSAKSEVSVKSPEF